MEYNGFKQGLVSTGETMEKKKRDRSEYNRIWYKRNKERKDEYSRKWAKKNPEKIREYSIKSYRKNKGKYNSRVNKTKRKYWIKDKFNNDIRKKTRLKYGKLKRGFTYHHTTNPYDRDKFIILEDKFHKYYHTNKNKFNMRGKI